MLICSGGSLKGIFDLHYQHSQPVDKRIFQVNEAHTT